MDCICQQYVQYFYSIFVTVRELSHCHPCPVLTPETCQKGLGI